VIEAETGLALHWLHQEQPDLVVLDFMLPGLDGFTITRSLRDPAGSALVGEYGNIPIVMLTARTEEVDRLTGFELGTDDYVTKPFSPRELVMRIKAVLRRAAPAASEDEKPLVSCSPGTTQPLSQGVMCRALPKELICCGFAAHPRQVFSRAQLLDQVWERILRRRKYRHCISGGCARNRTRSSHPVYIQTVGYRV
jgi:DNA-binding response OmpR family regulator